MKKPLYILKIGGSVATYKERQPLAVRRTLLRNIATELDGAWRNKSFNLILLHGSGGAGHHLAKRYALHKGTGNDPKKWQAAFASQSANQKLDRIIADILVENGLPVTPCHTASVITQKNGRLDRFDTRSVDEALTNGCIPLLYGEMVFDTTLGMSVCSGDTIAASLARTHRARKIFFASDIDGIFTADPHIHREAVLIERVPLGDIDRTSRLSRSHNVDVTGGLSGKIKTLADLVGTSVETIEIFNGFDARHYRQTLLGKPFPHTVISVQK